MRPFTVLIGILLGSSASVTFGLTAVLAVFCVLLRSHPTLSAELPRLLYGVVAFALLTAASAGSFFAQLRVRPWRGWAHAATAACFALVLLMYWPRRA
jgi:ABC-type nickel/cobalt efflux system permease component RcnA